jgi:hypothetical protein
MSIQGIMLNEELDLSGLCYFLKPEERQQLFDKLCETIPSQKRIPEIVSLKTGIKRPNVYLYMKGREKRKVPNAETTAKVVKVLHDEALNQAIYPILKPPVLRMLAATAMCLKWTKAREQVGDRISKSKEYVELGKELKER